MTAIIRTSILAAILLAPTAAGAQLEQVPQNVVQRIATAAGDALKSGKVASKAVKPDPAWAKAFGYRIGAAAVVVVPDKALLAGAPAGGQNPLPLALVITRSFTLGDFKAMIPPNRVPAVSVPDGPQDLSLFFVGLR